MYLVIRVVAFRGIKCPPYGSQRKHGTITQFCFNVGPASNTIDRHWVSNGLRRWPTLNRYWVGRPNLVCEVHRIDAYTDLSAMVVEGIGLDVEYILVSLVLSIIIFWTFRILAHEKNQYSYFSKILGQFSCLKLSNRLKPGLGVRELLFYLMKHLYINRLINSYWLCAMHRRLYSSQQTRGMETTLFQCWSISCPYTPMGQRICVCRECGGGWVSATPLAFCMCPLYSSKLTWDICYCSLFSPCLLDNNLDCCNPNTYHTVTQC